MSVQDIAGAIGRGDARTLDAALKKFSDAQRRKLEDAGCAARSWRRWRRWLRRMRGRERRQRRCVGRRTDRPEPAAGRRRGGREEGGEREEQVGKRVREGQGCERVGQAND